MARPKTPLISRDGAVAAALEVIDEAGLEGFSLTRVAQKLGVKTPSLYHHFRNKDDILAEVSHLILLQADEPRRGAAAADWKAQVLAVAIGARRSILRHAKAAPLLLTYPPRHTTLRGYERSLRIMERTGAPPHLFMTILSGMDAIVFGASIYGAIGHAQGVPQFPHFDPNAFPALTKAIAANRSSEEDMFVAVCRAFLDGLVPEGKAAAPRAQKRVDSSR